MATDTASSKPRQTAAIVRARLQDLCAGATCSFLTVAYSLSYATLVFSGPLAQWLGYGVAVTFLSAAIAGLVIGLRSSLPFAIAGPDSSTSAVMAAFVAAFLERIIAEGATEHLLERAIIVMALSTALTGAVLLVLGVSHAGRAIRFVPYPVVGGFLGATGWLIVMGGVQVATGQHLTAETVGGLFDVLTGEKLLAGALLAIALFLGQRRLQSPFALPGLLLTGVIAAHLALLAFGVTLDQAQAEGWMFAPQLQVALMSPWHSDMLVRFPWHALPSLFGDLLSVMFVAAITMLLNTSAVELATQREANLDRELNSHGIANLLIAAVGGVHRRYLSESNGGELFGRRDQLSLRDYGRLGCGSRRRRQSELSRLRAQMRAGRSPVLPWRQSALSVAGRFGAPAPAARISVVARDSVDHCPIGGSSPGF